MSIDQGGRSSEPERPRHEPEIIPPGERERRAENVFIYMDAQGNTRRMNIKPVSPFVVMLVLVAVAIVAAAILAVVLGALVFLIPLAALALAGLIGFAYARGLWRRVTGSAGSWRRG